MDNKLPSAHQIGDRVHIINEGTVSGVVFRHGKVLYQIDTPQKGWDDEDEVYTETIESDRVRKAD